MAVAARVGYRPYPFGGTPSEPPVFWYDTSRGGLEGLTPPVGARGLAPARAATRSTP